MPNSAIRSWATVTEYYMSHYYLFQCLVLAVLGLGRAAQGGAESSRRTDKPNIAVVLVDELVVLPSFSFPIPPYPCALLTLFCHDRSTANPTANPTRQPHPPTPPPTPPPTQPGLWRPRVCRAPDQPHAGARQAGPGWEEAQQLVLGVPGLLSLTYGRFDRPTAAEGRHGRGDQ